MELTKREIKFLLSIYKIFFAKLGDFDDIDDLSEYLLDQINYYDELLID